MVALPWPTAKLPERVPGYEEVVSNPVGGFLDSLLRGVSQIMFQNNPLTGALFLAGIFYNSVTFGLYALLGVSVSTLTAIAMGVQRDLWRAGLFGFNGTLVGIALAFFLEPSGAVAAYVIVGAALSTVIMAALLHLLSGRGVPALTAPFVLATWFLLFASFSFHVLDQTAFIPRGAFPSPVMERAGPSPGMFFDGFFRGFGQVMFQDNVGTGAFFLGGLLVNSPISMSFAAAGSLIGLLVGLGMGSPETALRSGLFGFNPLLTGIALGGFFLVLTPWSALFAVLGMVVTALLFPTFVNALTPWGMPALTAPFVITTWLFIAAVPFFRVLRPVPLTELSSPEGHLRAYAAAGGR